MSGRQRQTLVEAARERVTERTAQVVLITILGTRIHTDLWACAMVVFGSSVVFGSCGNFPARHQRRGDKSMGALSTLWSRQSSPGVASTGCVLCTRLYQPCHLASYAHEVAQLVPVAPCAASRAARPRSRASRQHQHADQGGRAEMPAEQDKLTGPHDRVLSRKICRCATHVHAARTQISKVLQRPRSWVLQ